MGFNVYNALDEEEQHVGPRVLFAMHVKNACKIRN